jgi:hypothetical protein
MATTTLKVTNRSDRFPVGTSVSAYPKSARVYSGKPAGVALATATVAADGSLTFTGLNEREPLVLWAEVGGESRYLGSEAPAPVTPPQTLKQRIQGRRALVGA